MKRSNHSILGFIFMMTMMLQFVSCSTLKSALRPDVKMSAEDEFNLAWTGRSHAEVVREFGAPDRTESDGRGGQILVYEDFRTITETDVDTHFGKFDPDYTTTQSTQKSYKHFFLDGNGRCYLVKTNQVLPGGMNDIHARKRRKVRDIAFKSATGLIALFGITMIISN